jgi:thiosulfate dehydrogenase (quinone) large subunit
MDQALHISGKNASAAYVLLRVTLGLNIFLHGSVRWASGLHHFAGQLTAAFQNTPLPSWSVLSFGYVLPILEAVIGAAILVGFQTRRALIAGGGLMLVLIFGTSLRQDWPTAGLQLVYSLVYAILLGTLDFKFKRDCVDSLSDREVQPKIAPVENLP